MILHFGIRTLQCIQEILRCHSRCSRTVAVEQLGCDYRSTSWCFSLTTRHAGFNTTLESAGIRGILTPNSSCAMALSLLSANLATLVLATLFYGIYFVLFTISMYLLFRRHNNAASHTGSQKTAPILWSMVFLSAVRLFLVVTGYWVILVYRAFIAFLQIDNGGGAETFYGDNAQLTSRILNVLLALSIFIGDSLIILRLWVVWSFSSLVLLVPICSLVLFTAASATSAHIIEGSTTVFSDLGLTVASILTLITNIYCTAFISWKIWRTTRNLMRSNAVSLRNFLAIVVESAAIYAFWAAFFTVTYQVKSNLCFLVIETGPGIIGIVNALIHTRVGLGWSVEQNHGHSWPTSPAVFTK
ncbi:hypothetical protein DFH07DRAFT_245029 [Mycena maculata]|uniref:Uncharacterized protein n=1 Tax=Mycena maculata TaxID=230809 RepID=A0AAD7HQU7_9AGAR|nr:hypothetical protein DFH07DRAFT_245029 [Mycena maculata]